MHVVRSLLPQYFESLGYAVEAWRFGRADLYLAKDGRRFGVHVWDAPFAAADADEVGIRTLADGVTPILVALRGVETGAAPPAVDLVDELDLRIFGARLEAEESILAEERLWALDHASRELPVEMRVAHAEAVLTEVEALLAAAPPANLALDVAAIALTDLLVAVPPPPAAYPITPAPLRAPPPPTPSWLDGALATDLAALAIDALFAETTPGATMPELAGEADLAFDLAALALRDEFGDARVPDGAPTLVEIDPYVLPDLAIARALLRAPPEPDAADLLAALPFPEPAFAAEDPYAVHDLWGASAIERVAPPAEAAPEEPPAPQPPAPLPWHLPEPALADPAAAAPDVAVADLPWEPTVEPDPEPAPAALGLPWTTPADTDALRATRAASDAGRALGRFLAQAGPDPAVFRADPNVWGTPGRLDEIRQRLNVENVGLAVDADAAADWLKTLKPKTE